MQKVITITTHANIIEKQDKYIELEYPILNSYIEKGYKVVQVIPVITNAASYLYSLTFVLEI